MGLIPGRPVRVEKTNERGETTTLEGLRITRIDGPLCRTYDVQLMPTVSFTMAFTVRPPRRAPAISDTLTLAARIVAHLNTN